LGRRRLRPAHKEALQVVWSNARRRIAVSDHLWLRAIF
jgi:hypothetical protein